MWQNSRLNMKSTGAQSSYEQQWLKIEQMIVYWYNSPSVAARVP